MIRSRKQLVALLAPTPAWPAVIAAVLLALIGIAAIDTSTHSDAMANRQAQWLVISLVGMMVCLLPRPVWLGRMSYWLLAGVMVLIAIMPVLPRSLVPMINGARCWIEIGGRQFQPSELAKITLILALAQYLRHRDNYRTLRGLLAPFAIMVFPLLLILRQPDLGTAVLFVPTLFGVLIAAGAKLRHLGALVAIGLLIVAVNVAVVAIDPPATSPAATTTRVLPTWAHPLKWHQEKRIAALMYPDRYEQTGSQQDVAVRLVGAGQVFGYGDRAQTIVRFNRLPLGYNDMIYAVIVNRWGLAGGGAVLFLYLVLVMSLLGVAGWTKHPFNRLAAVGFASIIFSQAALNIGVALGLAPVTGVTLPFVSYGGSSMLATFCMLGLTINFASNRRLEMAGPSFEFDRPRAAQG